MADAKPRRLDLPESLDAAVASELADSLRGARGQPVALGAGGVRRLGAQCAQVLLAAAAAWRADGLALTLVAPSNELIDALRLMGLTPDHLTAGERQA